MSPAPDAPVVLLVDDEEHILSSLMRCLRREGYTLVTAGDGQEALRVLDAQPVEVIVSDHKMPGMSGLELLRRAAERRPKAARLLLTGWPSGIGEEDLEACGIFALIAKPWDDAELKAALRRAVVEGTGLNF